MKSYGELPKRKPSTLGSSGEIIRDFALVVPDSTGCIAPARTDKTAAMARPRSARHPAPALVYDYRARPRRRRASGTNALLRGSRIAGYDIEGVLGAGSFGITYRGRERDINRTVAIKEYLPVGVAMRARDGATVQPVGDAQIRLFKRGLDRFRKEAETLVGFRHPNIVSVLHFFRTNGTAYMVMDYLEGESLAARIERLGCLAEAEVVGLLGPLLDGLGEIHEAGFLHRDIKPQNIYINADGTPVILDFGSAREALGLAAGGLTTIVTPGFAPHEQYYRAGKQGPWTDIYALGGVLYAALTGAPPPEAPARVVEDRMVPAVEAAGERCARPLLAAIDWALAVRPENRPQTVAEWRRTCVAAPTAPGPAEGGTLLLGSVAVEPPAAEPGLSAVPPASRRLMGMALALVAVILAAGGWYAADARHRAARRVQEVRRVEIAQALRLKTEAENTRQAEALARVEAAADAWRVAADARRMAEKRARHRAERRLRAAAEVKRQAEEEARRRAEKRARSRAEAARRPRREPRRDFDIDTRYDIVNRSDGFTVIVRYAPLQLILNSAPIRRECKARLRRIAAHIAARRHRRIDGFAAGEIRVRLDRGLIDVRTRCVARATLRYRD